MMKRNIKVYAYSFCDEWYFTKNKHDDCSVQPDKVEITLLPSAPPDTKRWLSYAIRCGLVVQPISTDDV